jgi:hypothetical protein
MTTWTTLYGGYHLVMFQPIDDPGGDRTCMAIQIPEVPWPAIHNALDAVTRTNARYRFLFVCDTREQADEAAAKAEKWLPQHRRIAYERAAAGNWRANP